ncbi:MAG TPA: hypothetical protein VHR45_09515 [Thermoanaerobaculia bacterium]|nr:hypothetical protein [Thermoanaerobaculia bacterium]
MARRELLRVTVVVEAPHDAVDPAEADRFLDGVLVGDPRLAGVLLVEDEPDLEVGVVMAREPGPPLRAAGDVQQIQIAVFPGHGRDDKAADEHQKGALA